MGKKAKKQKIKSQKTKKEKKTKKAKKVKKINHSIELRVAKKKDFLILDKYKKNGKDKVWKMQEGYPYWLFNSKGEIENKNYILDEHTNLQDFSDYLVREQVLILTSKFDS